MSNNWWRRRWLDFRNGHSTYLTFILAFSNFILIAYYFLIKRVTFFDSFIPNLWFFTAIFIIIYIPISILLGRWHRTTQYQTEVTAMWHEWPLMAKSLRLLVDMNLNKASIEELESMRNFFESIERKTA